MKRIHWFQLIPISHLTAKREKTFLMINYWSENSFFGFLEFTVIFVFKFSQNFLFEILNKRLDWIQAIAYTIQSKNFQSGTLKKSSHISHIDFHPISNWNEKLTQDEMWFLMKPARLGSGAGWAILAKKEGEKKGRFV